MTILNDLFDVKPFKAKYIYKLRNQYCHQVEKVKECILQLITCLKKEKKYDNTMLIIMADHGQALKENVYYSHRTFLYDELIHIPLLIKLPSIYSKQLDSSYHANLVDVHNFLRTIITEEDNPYQYFKMDRTFSEAFTLQYSKSSMKKYLRKDKAKNIYGKANLPRKVIIKDGKKLSLNENSEVEEFYTYPESAKQMVDSDDITDLLFDLNMFNTYKNFIINSQAIKMEIGGNKN